MTRFFAQLALGLAFVALLFAPRVARADERLRSYELDVTPDGASEMVTYRLRLEYLSTGPVPKRKGFKYFGSDTVEHWAVTDERGAPLDFTYLHEASSGEERLDFTVPPPTSPGGPQVVVVELRQPVSVLCGFTQCTADVPWAHKFKIPVDHMTVRVHGERADSDASFACTGSGASEVCTRDTDSATSLTVPLRKRNGAGDVLGAVLLLGVLGVGTWLLRTGLRGRRTALLRLRGVIPPAPEVPAYPHVGGYRAPAVIPVAAAAEPQLAPEDAASQKTRFTVVSILIVVALAMFAIGVHTRLPMTVTMAFAAVVVFGFESIYARLETGGTWLAVAPLLTALAAMVGGPFVGIGGIALGVVGHFIAIAPPGTFQGSGSSSSSCGGGGGGGGCGGGGGGGGGGCGG